MNTVDSHTMRVKTHGPHEFWCVTPDEEEYVRELTERVDLSEVRWTDSWGQNGLGYFRTLQCRDESVLVRVACQTFDGRGPFSVSVNLGVKDNGKEFVAFLPRTYALWNEAYGAATAFVRGWVALDAKCVLKAA